MLYATASKTRYTVMSLLIKHIGFLNVQIFLLTLFIVYIIYYGAAPKLIELMTALRQVMGARFSAKVQYLCQKRLSARTAEIAANLAWHNIRSSSSSSSF